jgi:peptidoglycan/xylan/chitin deacetylase (PgdA/CDA1 family)
MIAGARARARRFVVRHVGGSALVLMYHRVAKLDRDTQLLAVAPERFAGHMRVLAKDYRIISLDALAGALRERRLPKRCVAVTFDDGYADNLLAAEPVLSEAGVEATVFVSSGFVGGHAEFWWDELERLALDDEDLPASFTLRAGDAEFVARADAGWGPVDRHEERWTVLDGPSSPRRRLLLELLAYMRPLSGSRRESALAALRGQLGVTASLRPSHRQLTRDEVRELAASRFVGIGGHTVSHSVLSGLDESAQRIEIEQDRVSLMALGAMPLLAFSYPFGGFGDYTGGTARVAREAGYECACTTHEGLVKPWTDPMRLPRHTVRDWTEDEFSERIRGWFDEPR